MELNYLPLGDVPPLAYCVRIQNDRADVLHGHMVETTSTYFTDGVWAGNFSSGDFDLRFMSGTGAVVRQNALRLVSSNTPIDRIFIVRVSGEIFVSNSLVFLLEITGDELDTNFLSYRSFFVGTMVGMRISPRTFPTKRGRRVRVLLSETAEVTAEGKVTPVHRPLHRNFSDFHDYRNTLVRVMKRIVENASDASRNVEYQPLISLSTGYDSCAVAVLALEAGCNEAVTLLRYSDESGQRQPVDYPGAVAQKLGLNLRGIERDTWRGRSDFPDAEIAAASSNFIDIPFVAYEDQLAHKLLLVGHSGDNVWTRDNFRCYGDIVRGDTSGQGLAEYRLRVGFVVLPVPFIGHTAHPSIFRISNSEEMAPWSIGGHYDRPIARRIVEEAGIARNDFATRKYAGGALVGSMKLRYALADRVVMEKQMNQFMTRAGATSFLDYCERMNPNRQRAKICLATAAHWIYHKIDAVNYHVGKRLHSFGIKGLVPRRLMVILASKAITYPDYTYLFPHWGTMITADKYRSVKGTLSPSRGNHS